MARKVRWAGGSALLFLLLKSPASLSVCRFLGRVLLLSQSTVTLSQAHSNPHVHTRAEEQIGGQMVCPWQPSKTRRIDN